MKSMAGLGSGRRAEWADVRPQNCFPTSCIVVRCVCDEDDGYGEPLNYLAALLQISRPRLAVARSR